MQNKSTATCLPNQIGVSYRPVVGIPGYCVGDDGSVWSCWRRGGNNNSNPSVMQNEWHRLKDLNGNNGYRCVRIKFGDKIVHHRIHRLILEAFVGPRPKGMGCRHLDGNPANNQLGNLKWGTQPQNIEDTMRHDRVPKGTNHHHAKMCPEKIVDIRKRRANGQSFASIGRYYELSEATVRDIVHRKTWKHVL